ncbi:hypothetical protein HPB48_004798 [Haemaphysalis longicornis]|uniref:Uncharacterized protein n=1 Tax=Haemaphysalis longicornis TaxID=44386 RepID=A0A9J6FCD0_HAELO|nr:hypothetical protein HPB48_004798 [Haemaphysalis longicornis]
MELSWAPKKEKNLLLQHMEFTGKHPRYLSLFKKLEGHSHFTAMKCFHNPSITHRRRGIVDTSATPTMTLTYVRKDLPTTQNDTTHVNTPSHEHVSTTTLVGDHRLTVINVYWSPNQPSAPLPPLPHPRSYCEFS